MSAGRGSLSPVTPTVILTRKLHPDAKVATATGRILAVDWLESERNRLRAGSFWRTVVVDITDDGCLQLIGVPNDGEPTEVCRSWKEETCHA